MDASMNTNLDKSEIDRLEQVLNDFKGDLESIQSNRASKWRLHFFISFIITLVISITYPTIWWLGLIVIAYFAGSLYSILRLNAKTNCQIIEHQKQLKLVRLLRNFKTSPYSK